VWLLQILNISSTVTKGKLVIDFFFNCLDLVPFRMHILEKESKKTTSNPPSWRWVPLPSSSCSKQKVCLSSVPQAQACVIYALSIAFNKYSCSVGAGRIGTTHWWVSAAAPLAGQGTRGPRHCGNLPVLRGFAIFQIKSVLKGTLWLPNGRLLTVSWVSCLFNQCSAGQC